jgi:hypothetical protein
MSGIVGVNEWLTRWWLSESVDFLDNWDCFLGVNERCSRNGLHLNHTERDTFPANQNNHTARHIFLLILFVLPGRYRGGSK